MSQWSEDGACIPHWVNLSDAYAEGAKAHDFMQSNGNLKVGYVVAVHYPGDTGYEKEVEIRYDVVTEVSAGLDTSAWHTYYGCRFGARLGGSTNDFMRLTVRAPRAKYDASKGLTQEQRRESSRVLIECENGMSHAGWIVGFARHADLPVDDPELGHNYRWDFNGISTTISKDGEYAVTYSGAILDAKSNMYLEPDANKAGTFLSFLKDGSWTVDNVKGESILLDKTAKKTTLLGRSALIQTSEGNLDVKTKGKVDVQATGNAVFNSTAKVYIGKEGSTEPLVLGNKLAAALKELVDILSMPIIGQAGPFPCRNLLDANYRAWSQKYAKKNTSPFLSKKGFVT